MIVAALHWAGPTELTSGSLRSGGYSALNNPGYQPDRQPRRSRAGPIGRGIPEVVKCRILAESSFLHQLPLVYFTKGAESGDLYNWFMPNLRAFHASVESSGFTILRATAEGDWAWIAAEKAKRLFQFGVEGWSPG